MVLQYSCSKLNSQWEGKVKAIGSLEENLLQLQKSFAEKEKQLLLERDQALQSARCGLILIILPDC